MNYSAVFPHGLRFSAGPTGIKIIPGEPAIGPNADNRGYQWRRLWRRGSVFSYLRRLNPPEDVAAVDRWDEIEWIFEADGSLLDIYVQESSLDDWGKLLETVLPRYSLVYVGPDGDEYSSVDRDYVLLFLTDTSGELACPLVRVDLGHVSVNCHFFLPDQIEFDLDPNEIDSSDKFAEVEEFMTAVSACLAKQVTLTAENNPTMPLIKVNASRSQTQFVTQTELRRLCKRRFGRWGVLSHLRARIALSFFRRRTEARIIASASEPHRATKLAENLW